MTPSLLALAGLGLLLGFRHAFEPDHLAAVSTLATRQGRLLDACHLGLAWAVGHTASVGVVVAAIMIFGLRLPVRLWPAADFLVALLLMGLGGSVLLRYARGRWHLHVHAHDEGPHLHLHSHAGTCGGRSGSDCCTGSPAAPRSSCCSSRRRPPGRRSSPTSSRSRRAR